MGWTAKYITKKTAGQFDIGSMSNDQIMELARAGCLVAAPKTMTDAVGRCAPRLEAVIDAHRMPGGERHDISVKNEL